MTNIVIAGLGGQGVLKASDILADAAFRAGLDVKKSEIHGMSQRGGSVASDVRFGREVFSPMVPPGEADFLVVLAPTRSSNRRPLLQAGGVLDRARHRSTRHSLRQQEEPERGPAGRLAAPPRSCRRMQWHGGHSRPHLPEKLHAAKLAAFAMGTGSLGDVDEAGTSRQPTFHPASAPDFRAARRSCASCSSTACEPSWATPTSTSSLFRRAHAGPQGRRPRDIQSLDDIAQLPFTIKTDLRDTYPFGLFASPLQDVVRLHASSGTTGKPIVVAYTQDDVDGVDVGDGAQLRRLRSARGRHHPERLRLWPVHRRPGRALRRRRHRRHGHSRSPAATPTGRSW